MSNEVDATNNNIEKQTMMELQNFREQIYHKDSRILQLNNVILEKERQIIDLQEMCSEQGKVAKSKSLAMHIVNRRLQELDAKQTRDMATETTAADDLTLFEQEHPFVGKIKARSPRRISPGRAVPQFKLSSGNGSPPPLDPAEDNSSYTTDGPTILLENEEIVFKNNKKCKKKVTFDVDNDDDSELPKGIGGGSTLKNQADFHTGYVELVRENDSLQQIISQMEKNYSNSDDGTCNSTEEKITRSVSSQILKVKATAQAKIKQLETVIAETRLKADCETADLRRVIEQLNQSREWAFMENAKLSNELTNTRQKCDDLLEELDASIKTTDVYRKRINDNGARLEEMRDELYQNRAQIQHLTDEKLLATNECERLKEAIFAQDEFISLLEGDLIVYEAHVGILRDSLGTSKNEDRQNMKSKAFAAKINALETEKQEIVKKNNEEKLRAKALLIKVRCLEQEKDEIKAKLYKYEKEHEENIQLGGGELTPKPEQKEFVSIDTMTDDNDFTALSEIIELKEQISKTTQQNSLMSTKIGELNKENVRLSQDLAQLFETIQKFLYSLAANVSLFSAQMQSNDQCFKFDLNNTDISSLSGQLAAFEEIFIKTFEALNDNNNSLQKQIFSQNDEIQLKNSLCEQIEQDKTRCETELFALKEEFSRHLVNISQKDEQITTLEEKMASLLAELSNLQRQLETRQEESNLLIQEKALIETELFNTKQKNQNLNIEVDALKSELCSVKTDRDSLSKTLCHEQERLNKLIKLLREIVERFGGGPELCSSAYIENLIKEENGGSELSIKSLAPTTTEPMALLTDASASAKSEQQHFTTTMATADFTSKAVGVQVNLLLENDQDSERKLNELHGIVDAQQMDLCSMQVKIEELQGDVMESENSLQRNLLELEEFKREQDQFTIKHRELIAERDDLIAERDGLLKQTAHQATLYNQLQDSQKTLIAELNELTESKKQLLEHYWRNYWIVEQFDAIQQSLVETGIQTAGIEMEDQCVQIDAIPTAIKEVAVQMEPITTESVLVQTDEQEIMHFIKNEEEECQEEMQGQQSNSSNAEEIVGQELVRRRQQSDHQLLIDCIQDRQELERDFDAKIQQLVELKTELESSVDVLKGEMWSLNEELKKRLDERNVLRAKNDELEEQLKNVEMSKEEMRLQIEQKTVDLIRLNADLEQSLSNGSRMEKHVEELNGHVKEKAQRVDLLENIVHRFKQTIINKMDIQNWHEDLDYVKHLVNENRMELHLFINTIYTAVERFKVFLLLQQGHHFRPLNCPKCLFHLDVNSKLAILAAQQITMRQRYEALLRENSKLIEMNKMLQLRADNRIQQNDELNDTCNNSSMEEEESETMDAATVKNNHCMETSASFQFVRENDEIESKVNLVLDEKFTLDADIVLRQQQQQESQYNKASCDDGIVDVLLEEETDFNNTQKDGITNTNVIIDGDNESPQQQLMMGSGLGGGTDDANTEEEVDCWNCWNDKKDNKGGHIIEEEKKFEDEFQQQTIVHNNNNSENDDWSWNDQQHQEEEEKEQEEAAVNADAASSKEERSIKLLFDDW